MVTRDAPKQKSRVTKRLLYPWLNIAKVKIAKVKIAKVKIAKVKCTKMCALLN
jgi:hypothetical protein